MEIDANHGGFPTWQAIKEGLMDIEQEDIAMEESSLAADESMTDSMEWSSESSDRSRGLFDETEQFSPMEEEIMLVDPLGKSELMEELVIETEDNLRRFLRSEVFFPYWRELYVEYIFLRQQLPGQFSTRDPSLEDIQVRLRQGECFGQRRYSYTYADKMGWGPMDHLARFICGVREANINCCDGLFWCRPQVSEARADFVIWSLYCFLRDEHSPSRLEHPFGGIVIMGDLRDEALAHLARKRFPTLPMASTELSMDCG